MRVLPGKAHRTKELRSRTPFERRLRAAELTVLGMWIVAAAVVFVPNFARSRLQAEEIARRAVACQAVQQYTLDRGAPPESFDDLIQFKYISSVAVDAITREKLSLPDCVGGPEEYMDPIETIPGFRHLYSYSPGESGTRPRAEE